MLKLTEINSSSFFLSHHAKLRQKPLEASNFQYSSYSKNRFTTGRYALSSALILATLFLITCQSNLEESIEPPKITNGQLTNIKSFKTRFIGHFSDLGPKDQKIIAEAKFREDGSIISLENNLNYPYNFEDLSDGIF